jgi:hypothetical protein
MILKLLRPPNTDGWGNKLVTIFARHLDNFILTNNFAIIFKIRDFGSRQILPPGQLNLSPGFAKIAPYPPCTVTTYWLKYQDPARMLRRVTFTPSTAGPLCLSWLVTSTLSRQISNVLKFE